MPALRRAFFCYSVVTKPIPVELIKMIIGYETAIITKIVSLRTVQKTGRSEAAGSRFARFLANTNVCFAESDCLTGEKKKFIDYDLKRQENKSVTNIQLFSSFM